MAVSPIPAPRTSRRTVKSFREYEAAERAVDWLSDRGFPVEHVPEAEQLLARVPAR